MSLNIDELAVQIATLNPVEQEALLEKVAALTFQRGFATLSQQYRERLVKEEKLNQSAEEVMAALEEIRDAVAAYDQQA